MSRNLVLCFDGTNNQYNSDNTNVVKLLAMLDRADPDQFVYYQPGIGTMTAVGMYDKFKKKIAKIIDLAFANLLDDHVKGGYRFLMDSYQPGDQIFLFGFSRGAYTARVLAGMLLKVGLLPRGNDEMVAFSWDIYANEPVDDVSRGFKKTFSRSVPIRFLGLWDTVSSISWAWHPKVYAYTRNNESVQTVRHALALDERRQRFAQNTWTDQPPTQQHVKEVWFPGVHCDVGGGYAEAQAGLSKLSLQWMVDELKDTPLRFDAEQVKQTLPADAADKYPIAKKHESLTFLWWPVEFIPLPSKDPTKGYKTHWSLHLGGPRRIPTKPWLHKSIFLRQQKDPTYQPRNLPVDYTLEPEANPEHDRTT
jgi:uncharacterized protein (DUF2235 family)